MGESSNSYPIKSQYGSDTRRFRCSSYYDLRNIISNIYELQSKFSIKYRDEEGDLITIGTDAELIDAAQNQPQALKIIVFAKNEGPAEESGRSPKRIKQEASVPLENGTSQIFDSSIDEPGYNCVLVRDVTPLKGSSFIPGETFNKIWKIKNSGTLAWNSAFTLTQTAGETFSEVSQISVGEVPAGTEAYLTIPMRAPKNTGRRYVSIWKICTSQGQTFGEPLEIDIFVDNNPTKASTPIVSFGTSLEQASAETQARCEPKNEKQQAPSNNQGQEPHQNNETTGFPYMNELSQLLDMGFSYEAVKSLLNKFNGSLLDVLSEVLRS